MSAAQLLPAKTRAMPSHNRGLDGLLKALTACNCLVSSSPTPTRLIFALESNWIGRKGFIPMFVARRAESWACS
jgi:hypothetical protein